MVRPGLNDSSRAQLKNVAILNYVLSNKLEPFDKEMKLQNDCEIYI
jgi:hypothetical protein